MDQQVLHYPRLDTMLMVEEAIRKSGTYQTKAELWRSLPKKTMYQTLLLILDYLMESKKIIIDRDGQIVWVWNPALVKKLTSKGLLLQ